MLSCFRVPFWEMAAAAAPAAAAVAAANNPVILYHCLERRPRPATTKLEGFGRLLDLWEIFQALACRFPSFGVANTQWPSKSTQKTDRTSLSRLSFQHWYPWACFYSAQEISPSGHFTFWEDEMVFLKKCCGNELRSDFLSLMNFGQTRHLSGFHITG